ncbi:unnamed protein product [Ascophyllum nodosum]
MMATPIDGVAVTGPMLHVIYALMEYFIPTTGAGFLPAAAHLALDFLVLDPFFCLANVAPSGQPSRTHFPRIREFWPAVQATWVVSFFSPIQFLSFRYLPLELRVLPVDLCDIVWTSVMSYISHKHKA